MKTTITILLTLIVSVSFAQSLDTSKVVSNSEGFITMPYMVRPPLPKNDTVCIIFLEMPDGVDVNPYAWLISDQSNINMPWKRGFACRHWEYSFHPDYATINEKPWSIIDSYLYIDRKTKVEKKVIFSVGL